jgi:hypothetical protein
MGFTRSDENKQRQDYKDKRQDSLQTTKTRLHPTETTSAEGGKGGWERERERPSCAAK